jgi:hypothetical protein
MKLIKTVLVLTSMLLVAQAMPIKAQSMNQCMVEARANGDSFAQLMKLGRAQNLARQTAEIVNGGLGEYRADRSMYGRMSDTPCTVSGDDLWTFTFKGTAPNSNIPYVETAVVVNNQTWEIKVDRNTRLY